MGGVYRKASAHVVDRELVLAFTYDGSNGPLDVVNEVPLTVIAELLRRAGYVAMTAKVEAIRRWGLDGEAFTSGHYCKMGRFTEKGFHMLGIGDSFEEAFDSAQRAGYT